MNAVSWAQRVQRLTSGNGLRAQLLRGGVGSLVIKAAHAALAFALAVVLARTLGPEGYGTYSFALAIIMLSAIPAQVGVPQLIIRETAKAQANGNYGLMRGLWRWSNLAVVMLSALALVAVAGMVGLTEVGGDGARVATLTVGIALIPIIALANVRGACLRGLRKVVQGQLPESIIRPALLLCLVLVLSNWFVEDEFTPQMAMAFYVFAAIFAFIIGAWLLRRSWPAELGERPVPEYQSTAWRKAVIPLGLISGLHLVNSYADLIILGLFRPDDEVGIYRAVSQLALLIIFGLQAINQVLHPHFARLYANGDKDRLQRLVTMSARAILAMASLPFLAFLFFGENVLSLAFGSEYALGAAPLAILALGQLANAAFGSVGALLNMTGHERDTMRGMLIAMGINVALNFVVVPPFGMNGAAIATAISYLVWNAVLRYYVHRRLSIESSAFGRRSRTIQV